MCYMDAEDIAAILREPDRSCLEGHRDHALLAFLYNTGARIQEALDVCPRAIRFESPAHVELLGKGRKSRICPLWPETVAVLKALLRQQPRADHEPIFLNRYGQPLGAAGGTLQIQEKLLGGGLSGSSPAAKSHPPPQLRPSLRGATVAARGDVAAM